MPGLGDHHSTGTSINPFEPARPRITEYTAKEIATLSTRLEKQLGPEYISSRPGAGGGKVHYLAAEKCISLANDVFGFNGWSSAIQNIQIDFVDESQSTGKVSLGLSVTVRVTLRDGTYHEDIGYGHIENCKGKAAAFEKAKKEGTTDALKRALRNFGNLLGNCIYDKDYVAKVTKLKCAPTKWDPDNLHRHPDYVSVKKENIDSHRQLSQDSDTIKGIAGGTEQKPIDDSDLTLCGDGEDEFGSDGFDEADFNVANQDHPDQILLETVNSSRHSQQKNIKVEKPQMLSIQTAENRGSHNVKPYAPTPCEITSVTSGAKSFVKEEATYNLRSSNLVEAQNDKRSVDGAAQKPRPPYIAGPDVEEQRTPLKSSRSPNNPNPPKALREKTPPDSHSIANPSAPVGFYTARAAESVQGISNFPANAPVFDPHLESPSIRKTIGVDHSTTKPVGKDMVAASPIIRQSSSDFINPHMDKARRVGMPMSPVGPLHNRNSYKPPQMKRPGDVSSAQFSRPALSDVTSVTVNLPSDTNGDFKRPKVVDNNHDAVTAGANQMAPKR